MSRRRAGRARFIRGRGPPTSMSEDGVPDQTSGPAVAGLRRVAAADQSPNRLRDSEAAPQFAKEVHVVLGRHLHSGRMHDDSSHGVESQKVVHQAGLVVSHLAREDRAERGPRLANQVTEVHQIRVAVRMVCRLLVALSPVPALASDAFRDAPSPPRIVVSTVHLHEGALDQQMERHLDGADVFIDVAEGVCNAAIPHEDGHVGWVGLALLLNLDGARVCERVIGPDLIECFPRF